MAATAFRTHVDTPLEVDICWSCHLIWFDNLESVSMSPQSVIDLFSRIHSHRNEPRRLVSLTGDCPSCRDKLVQTFDVARGGRFQYHRCPNGHGRLITFVQFLREKQFIRTLSQAERKTLSAQVKQIRCSSCGAGVDLEHHATCGHCGAPVAVLDEQAVAKALEALETRAARRKDLTEDTNPRPASTRPAPTYPSTPSTYSEPLATPELVDLVLTGVAAILAATLD
jgi:hypothetical protein